MVYKFKNHEIEVFDNIQELPMMTFQKFNKYQMMASEVGNDFEDYDRRTLKTISFLKKKMYEQAIQELENRRLTVFNAYSEFSPTLHSFAVLVKRIDKKEYSKKTSENIEEIVKDLNDIGLDNKSAIEKLVEVKKKIEKQLQVYFTNYFGKNTNQDLIALRIKRMNLLLDDVIEGNAEENIYEVEKEILEHDRPNIWNVFLENNMEKILEVDFNKFIFQVKEHININHKEITVFEFYSALDFIKDKQQSNKQ